MGNGHREVQKAHLKHLTCWWLGQELRHMNAHPSWSQSTSHVSSQDSEKVTGVGRHLVTDGTNNNVIPSPPKYCLVGHKLLYRICAPNHLLNFGLHSHAQILDIAFKPHGKGSVEI
eukprot:Blabericola_migrator_1__11202@NODE_657_length_7016_cov_177_727587_g481_i0_p7_GENE_NODE_657_length_7016_cov_177_727587_g481_i0NODE_657_length_7016_cov_177_727587_g481_i0_p7_ORF_typecomplete_len116_score9_34QHAmDH_gamma/PF08992_11/0_033_NODE_657_length_7016_cov_177_727587_g481_i051495496